MAGHLADELFEVAIIEGPLFNGADQFHRHIERAGGAVLLEGQMPAGLGTARSLEGREAAFQEGAQLSDLAQSGLAGTGVSVGNDPGRVHGGWMSGGGRRKSTAWF